jgi:cytoskeleton-associated protein 5
MLETEDIRFPAYDPMLKQKAPKVLADSVGWVNQALTEFGIAGLMLRPLIEFLKTALKNSNAAVRTSATSTLVTLRLFAGAGPYLYSGAVYRIELIEYQHP